MEMHADQLRILLPLNRIIEAEKMGVGPESELIAHRACRLGHRRGSHSIKWKSVWRMD